ncbi:MAG: TonB-dependent receptor, partial [Bacteroidota bacterium]
FIIRGRVEDERSGESLPHASVVVQGTRIGGNTNDDGYFTIREVPADTVTLIIKYLGYQTKRLQITPETQLDGLLITLQAIDVQMQEVLIVADEEHMMESKGISHLSISPAQLAALPSLGEKDIFRSLQMMPGVSGSNENSSGLYVRGGTPDQNLILLDGFTVYHVDHFFGFFSAFNADAIKDVQFYKGGFSAKYGERLSSVVELSGKSGNKNQWDGGLNLSALSISGRVEGPIGKKATFFLAARRSYTDIIQSGLYDNIYELVTPSTDEGAGGPGGPGGGRFVNQATPDFYFYDLNARLTYNPSERDVLSLSFYNGIDNLDNSFDNSQTGFGRGLGSENSTFSNQTVDLTRWGNWGASARWSRQWNDRWYSNATLAYSNYFSNRDRSTEIVIQRDTSLTEINRGTVEDNNVQDLTFRFNNELKLSTHNQIDLGTQITYNDIRYNLIQNDTLPILDQQGSGSRIAFYAQDHWQPFKWLSLSGG